MDSGRPTHLDAPFPGARPRGLRPRYLVSRLISSYIGYFLVMGVLVLLVPLFEPAFLDTNTHLRAPAATVFLLNAGRSCRRHFLWAYLIPLPALWAVINANIADKHRRRRLRLGAFIFVVGFLLFTLLALFLPMSHVLQGSSSTTQR